MLLRFFYGFAVGRPKMTLDKSPRSAPQSESWAIGPAREDEPASWGAAQMAQKIRSKQISAQELLAACWKRIEASHAAINALVIPLRESAEQAARSCDEQLAKGETLGPLAGVPVSIKECFHVRGTDACIGLSALVGEKAPADGSTEGPLVKLLRDAGSVIVGKTNVPQLMMWNECDNPVYGLTKNPWDVTRTPGGSSGGEAALIAAGGSALGLVNDLGGSIRVPAHFCGLAGLKPTSYRLSRAGTRRNFRGVIGMATSCGPMARHVEDLELAMQVWLGEHGSGADPYYPIPYGHADSPSLKKLRVVSWKEDGVFPLAPAVQRAIDVAIDRLRQAGVFVEEMAVPTFLTEAMEIFLGLLTSDGGADLTELAKGSKLDWRVARLLWLGTLGPIRRELIASLLSFGGQKWQAKILRQTASSSGKKLWKWRERQDALQEKFVTWLKTNRYDAILSAPYATAALSHEAAIDLVGASSYALWANLFGMPAGVVPVTNVIAHDVPTSPPMTSDVVLKKFHEVQQNSVGLPVGVQIAAPHWREDICLSLMKVIEH